MANTPPDTDFLGAQWALLPDGWRQSVRLEVSRDGVITSLGSLNDGPVTEVLDIIIPGMINVHSHAFQRKLVGRTQRFTEPNDDFWSWRTRMYADVESLTPEDQNGTAYALYRELLLNGYTTVCEFHYSHGAENRSHAEVPALMADAVVQAGQSSGIRLVLLPVLYQQGGFGSRPPSKDQRSFVLDTKVYLGLMDQLFETYKGHERLSFGYAPHSLRAVEFQAFRDLLDHRADIAPLSPIHIHVSEQVREVTECKMSTGVFPIEWLFKHFKPDHTWCLIHSTHASPGELAAIIRSGVTIGLCPTTEGDLGDGAFPFGEYLASGGRFGIGTDSNVCVSPSEELRFLDYQARILSRKRNAFRFDGLFGSGTRLYQAALEGGRKASALAVGRIEVGSAADLVELTSGHPLVQGLSPDEIMNAYIYSLGKEAIGRVFVAGKSTL